MLSLERSRLVSSVRRTLARCHSDKCTIRVAGGEHSGSRRSGSTHWRSGEGSCGLALDRPSTHVVDFALMSRTSPQPSDAEWKVLNALWREHPASARDLLDRLSADTGWAYTTLKTILTRMEEKGLVRTQM